MKLGSGCCRRFSKVCSCWAWGSKGRSGSLQALEPSDDPGGREGDLYSGAVAEASPFFLEADMSDLGGAGAKGCLEVNGGWLGNPLLFLIYI